MKQGIWIFFCILQSFLNSLVLHKRKKSNAHKRERYRLFIHSSVRARLSTAWLLTSWSQENTGPCCVYFYPHRMLPSDAVTWIMFHTEANWSNSIMLHIITDQRFPVNHAKVLQRPKKELVLLKWVVLYPNQLHGYSARCMRSAVHLQKKNLSWLFHSAVLMSTSEAHWKVCISLRQNGIV